MMLRATQGTHSPMADVFISYKSERRPAAQHLADIIEAHGFSVWFDYDLVPGKNFGRRIEEELRASKAAVVLWCSMSVTSEWVQDEADLAKKLGRFVPARMESCEPPLGFRRDDFVDISAWDGDPRSALLDRLFDRLETLVGRPAAISRKRIVELHTGWATMGRPTLAQFALGTSRVIAEADRRMPSSEPPAPTAPQPSAAPQQTAAPIEPATSKPEPTHDYVFWKSEWDAHKSGTDLVPLRAIADHAPPYFASQAQIRIAEIEAERQAARILQRAPIAELQAKLKAAEESVAKRVSEHVTARLKEAGERGRTEAEARAEGRIKIDASIFHGDTEAARAGWLKPGAGKTEWFKDLDIGPEMVVVPGDPPFAIGRFTITFAEWDAAQAHPLWRKITSHAPYHALDEGWGRGKQPVINVSWDDANLYCAFLSAVTGKIYRLPDMAEWGTACLTNTDFDFWWGNRIFTDQANFNGGRKNGLREKYRRRTVPVDCFQPNEWGLYQVHGNVAEWMENLEHFPS